MLILKNSWQIAGKPDLFQRSWSHDLGDHIPSKNSLVIIQEKNRFGILQG